MTPSGTARIDATVSGLVQGVFFRRYTLHEAHQLNLVGWVANHPDGTVRVVAEGEDVVLRRFLEFLQRGSPAAEVSDVMVDWSPATGEFTDFRVHIL